MLKINKAEEWMTSRERVRRTFEFEKTDRVPIDYSANPAINQRLMEAAGAQDTEELLELLGVDFRSADAKYIGPKLFDNRPGYKVSPEYGVISRFIRNNYGGYDDFCCFPLKGADAEIISAWPTPDSDDYDYADAVRQAALYKERALSVGHPGYPDIINSLGRVMGMEDTLVNLQLRDEATLSLLNRKTAFELGKLERLLDALVKAGVETDFLWLGEDLGTQIAPMISRTLFTEVFRPIFTRFIDLAKSYSLPVMVHTCGSSSWAYEDFIDMGVNAVDTLQPEATDMSPEYLKAHFSGRLSFHGCISTAAIASQDAAGVTDLCIRTLELLMPARGYHFSPTHMIQDNTPVENIAAMYQAAHTYGIYGGNA